MTDEQRAARIAELQEIRERDPVALLLAYRRIAGLNATESLPSGVTFTMIIQAIVDNEPTSGKQLFAAESGTISDHAHLVRGWSNFAVADSLFPEFLAILTQGSNLLGPNDPNTAHDDFNRWNDAVGAALVARRPDSDLASQWLSLGAPPRRAGESEEQWWSGFRDAVRTRLRWLTALMPNGTKELLPKLDKPKGSNMAFVVDGIVSLPVYSMLGVAAGDIPAFGSGTLKVQYVEPQLEPSPFRCDADSLERASNDWDFAMSAVKSWNKYLSSFFYYAQFKDDTSRVLITSVNDHAELLSKICDLRLGLDPTPFGRTFFAIMQCSVVQSEYRKNPARHARYAEYATQLDERYNEYTEHMLNAEQLCARMERHMESKRGEWPALRKLYTPPASQVAGLKLFCSYSHLDEAFRNKCESHLALLRREGTISIWHDRKITAGNEWKGEISEHLQGADIIALLISADFLNSDYCFDIEMQSAMKQHEAKQSRVVPIVLRACEWHSASFGKLLALPTDGKPISSWPNMDEAFTDVAKGVRAVAAELRAVRIGL
jgi:hypothetical protein